jgi:hypothetical protein
LGCGDPARWLSLDWLVVLPVLGKMCGNSKAE